MGVQGGGADADGVMVGGGGFGIQDDHRELTPFPEAGDLLNASFFLEPEVSPVHSSALDLVVGVHAEDSVMHVGDADGTVAMVDTDDRGNSSQLTLWCVTADRWLKATSTPSSKSLIYKKEKKTSSLLIM